MPTILQPDILFAVGLNFLLLLIILVFWIGLRRRISEIQADQERHGDQLDVLENKMARIEGALFYGPSATWTMEHRKRTQDQGQTGPSDPRVRKDL